MRYRVLETADRMAEVGKDPLLVYLDETGLALPALSERAAATTAVVRGLTPEGEEVLMRAGFDEVMAFEDLTSVGLARGLNRARVRHAMARDAEGARRTAYGILDRLPLGLILTRPDGRVAHANAPARRILQDGRNLGRTRDGFLVAADTGATARLRAAIAAVATGDPAAPEGAIAVTPADGGTPVSVILVPAGPAHPGAALFIADPEAGFSISDERLMSLYGLTRSEAQIVARLARGQTLEEIAAERGQQVTTIRTQVKSVFRKTNTRRQSDVIKLVLSGPAVITTGARGDETSDGSVLSGSSGNGPAERDPVWGLGSRADEVGSV
ncbi:DNA-binding transcriptional regulator, CsgD family [Rhodospira trueperi]|uniref:DNA-binding transcriptional regulator, CsgD family n=1 Tax=Rhodospira trueperi TaxID=69960 RepID=A0A1G7FU17_9PROT|nr:DNA-binding transcriptional regulator, CsgD family [Rhodospira trueperi]